MNKLLLILSLFIAQNLCGASTDSLYAEGVKLARQGKLSEAKVLFQQVSQSYKEAGKTVQQAMAMNDVATCDAETGRLFKAIKHYEQIHKLLQKQGVDSSSVAYAKTLFNLSQYTYKVGDLLKAEQYGKQSLTIMKGMGKKYYSQLASVYNNLGVIQAALENNSESISYYKKSKELYGKMRGPENYLSVNTNENLAMRNIEMKDSTMAHDYLARAGELMKTAPPSWKQGHLAAYYKSWGDYYVSTGKKKKATQFYQQAFEADSSYHGGITPSGIVYLSRLAWLGKKEGDAAAAEKYSKKCLDLIRKNKLQIPRQEAGDQLYLAWAHQQQDDLKGALNHAERSLDALGGDLATFPLDPSLYLEALQLKADLQLEQYRKTNDRELLSSAHSTAVRFNDLLEKFSRKLRLKEMNALVTIPFYRAYDTQMQIALAGIKFNREKYERFAWHVMENTKGIIHKLCLNNISVPKFAGVPDSVLKNGETMRAQCAYLKSKMSGSKDNHAQLSDRYLKVSEKLDAHLKRVEKEYPHYATARYGLPMAGMDEAQAYARKNQAAVVSYLWSNDKLYGLLLDGKEARWLTLGSTGEIKKICREFRKTVSQHPEPSTAKASFDRFSGASDFLYGKLVAPFIKNENFDRLVVIPDGILGLINFELLGPSSDSKNFIDYHYLLKDMSVQYGSSLTTLLRGNAAGNSAEKEGDENDAEGAVFALAPDFSSGSPNDNSKRQVGPLPGAQQEVKTLAEIFGGRTELHENMSRDQWFHRTGNMDVLHFATHAFVESKHPLNSAIAVSNLADEKEQARWLTAADLYNLHFKAGLVTLSACNTGMGTYSPGEGVMSLARSFQHNVSPNVVMSLWQVQDQATQEIMDDFYRSVKQGSNLETSLQKAKLDYLNNADSYLAHPYFWSPWILAGRGDNPLVQGGSPADYWWWLVLAIALAAFAIYRWQR